MTYPPIKAKISDLFCVKDGPITPQQEGIRNAIDNGMWRKLIPGWQEDGVPKKKRKKAGEGGTTEAREQSAVLKWLNHYKYFHISIPNSGKRTAFQGHFLKSQGLCSGAFDLLIFTVPQKVLEKYPWCRGCALEMKKDKSGRLSEYQKEFMENIKKENWIAVVGYGADSAIDQLKEHGWGT